MLTGSADFAVGLIWVGLPCWEVLSVNMFTFFFLDQFPREASFCLLPGRSGCRGAGS